jgi:hypothetical protein
MANLDSVLRDWLVSDRIGVIRGVTPQEVMAKTHAIFTASKVVRCSIPEFEAALWRLGYGVTCDERGCRLCLPESYIGIRNPSHRIR